MTHRKQIWCSENSVNKLIDALKKIRELQIFCKDCNGDCSLCYGGNSLVFEEADNALKEFEKEYSKKNIKN